MNILNKITSDSRKDKKSIAVLLDPDKCMEMDLGMVLGEYEDLGVDYLFIGGSLLTEADFSEFVSLVEIHCEIPKIIFPGNSMQISPEADAILFLSLISGRNSNLLIGEHVIAAPSIKKSGLETIPTGYMLVDCGNTTTAHYMSQSLPIPFNKYDIASTTAMAGEMLGLKLMYLDGGSGSKNPISPQMIESVKANTNTPLIVGGGIRNVASMNKAFGAGADIVVIGNSLEENPELIHELLASEHLSGVAK